MQFDFFACAIQCSSSRPVVHCAQCSVLTNLALVFHTPYSSSLLYVCRLSSCLSYAVLKYLALCSWTVLLPFIVCTRVPCSMLSIPCRVLCHAPSSCLLMLSRLTFLHSHVQGSEICVLCCKHLSVCCTTLHRIRVCVLTKNMKILSYWFLCCI